MKSKGLIWGNFLPIERCQVHRIRLEHTVSLLADIESEMSEILQENLRNLIREKKT